MSWTPWARTQHFLAHNRAVVVAWTVLTGTYKTLPEGTKAALKLSEGQVRSAWKITVFFIEPPACWTSNKTDDIYSFCYLTFVYAKKAAVAGLNLIVEVVSFCSSLIRYVGYTWPAVTLVIWLMPEPSCDWWKFEVTCLEWRSNPAIIYDTLAIELDPPFSKNVFF